MLLPWSFHTRVRFVWGDFREKDRRLYKKETQQSDPAHHQCACRLEVYVAFAPVGLVMIVLPIFKSRFTSLEYYRTSKICGQTALALEVECCLHYINSLPPLLSIDSFALRGIIFCLFPLQCVGVCI